MAISDRRPNLRSCVLMTLGAIPTKSMLNVVGGGRSCIFVAFGTIRCEVGMVRTGTQLLVVGHFRLLGHAATC